MKRNRRWLWAALALLVCGCGGEDVDRLGRIAAMATAKIEDAAGGPHGKLANGWQAMCGAAQRHDAGRPRGRAPPLGQAAGRRRHSGEAAGPGVVRLQGTVADAAQQQRAKELAESTQGVEQVVNELVIGRP